MTTTDTAAPAHALDQPSASGGAADSGDWLTYAETRFRDIPEGDPIPMDVVIAAQIGHGLALREYLSEMQRARAAREGLASASFDDVAVDDQQQPLDFPLDAADKRDAEATG